MKYSRFVAMYCVIHVVFIEISGISQKSHNCDLSIPFSDIRLRLIFTSKYRLHLHLKYVHRVLANEHLPVWVMKKSDKASSDNLSPDLIFEDKVMDQLGDFTFYQDPMMNSAAVYFHRRQELDGMIDTRYLIQGLSIDRIRGVGSTILQLGKFGIILRPESIDHPSNIDSIEQDDVVMNDDKFETRMTYGNRLFPGYPEILVIVSCNLVEKVLKNAQKTTDYSKIVSYVLTLFNGVDMLYSKLVETKIQLNIAGIIIEPECKPVSFVADCYGRPINATHDYSNMLDDSCITEKVEKFITSRQNEIPDGSYDVVIFLTREILFSMQDGEELEGVSLPLAVYTSKKSGALAILTSVVREDGYFRNYITVAHELAHLMNVDHDLESDMEDGECCGKIMKLGADSWCKQCSSWSDKSEKAFKTFFSSSDSCGFINIPRSIYPSKPRVMVTAVDQCQCYGYKSTVTPVQTGTKFCTSFLKCLDDDDVIHETLAPLDGTQCRSNKVCWQRRCRRIRHTVKSSERPMETESITPIVMSVNE